MIFVSFFSVCVRACCSCRMTIFVFFIKCVYCTRNCFCVTFRCVCVPPHHLFCGCALASYTGDFFSTRVRLQYPWCKHAPDHASGGSWCTPKGSGKCVSLGNLFVFSCHLELLPILSPESCHAPSRGAAHQRCSSLHRYPCFHHPHSLILCRSHFRRWWFHIRWFLVVSRHLLVII